MSTAGRTRSAPGLVGKRLVEKILRHQAPDKWARPIQNAMHWGTGMGWSVAFGITTGSAARQPWAGRADLWPGCLVERIT